MQELTVHLRSSHGTSTHRKYWGGTDIILPGLTNEESLIRCKHNFAQSIASIRCRLPSEPELTVRWQQQMGPGRQCYVKLHGSCDWIGADGSNRMVLGRGKRDQIEREPLLKWYSTLFRDALMEPRARLLAIGYGFGDRHINEALVDGSVIWQGVTNYFQSSLREMFPSQDQAAPEWARVQAFLRS